MFERAHHQRILKLLHLMDADLLAANGCFFGAAPPSSCNWASTGNRLTLIFFARRTTGTAFCATQSASRAWGPCCGSPSGWPER